MLNPLTMSLIGPTLQGEDIMLCIIIEYSSFKEFWVLETSWDYSNLVPKGFTFTFRHFALFATSKIVHTTPSSIVINP